MEDKKIVLNADSHPTIKQLQEVMRIEEVDIATQWRNLGLELVDSNKILREIETNHRNDISACCRVMFEKWLEMKPNANWNELVTALESIKLNTAANAITKLFKSSTSNQIDEKSVSLLGKISTPNEASIEFAILLREIIKELKKNESENLEIIKDICPNLTAKDDAEVLLFNESQLQAIDHCSDIRRMFKENLRGCWRWDDFAFLSKIIRYIDSSVCKELVNKYQQNLNYKMKLKDICDHCKKERSSLPDGYAEMFAIVEKNFFEITLGEYSELKEFTSRYCGVESMFMSPLVSAGQYSSVLFEWCIPLAAISYMVKVATTNADIFIQRSFVLLKISSAMIFDKRVNENWTPLYYATKYGQAAVVETLLKSASVEMINRWGTLHTAARYGHVPVVDTLINLGANVDGISIENWTPLLTAARNDHPAVVETLIRSGADVNRGNLDKWTPLQCAARHGNAKVVETLIKSGANIYGGSVDKWTPLHIAARHGHVAVVETLVIDGKVNINAGNTSKWTPLHTAARQGHVSVVQAMIKLGADPSITDSNKMTPLHTAAEQGHILVVEALINSGADVNAVMNDEWCPLHFAAEYNRVQVLKCLIESGANVCAVTKDDKYTPLHLAAQNGHARVVEILLKSRAYIDAITTDKQSPLHIAARNGKNSTVETLIKLGANINATEIHHWSPLHLAVQNGHDSVVRLLVRSGADVNASDKDGSTSLHFAAKINYVRIVELLITLGANVNACDKNLYSPLHLAAKHDRIEVVEILGKAGSDVNIVNKYQRTPLHTAIYKDNVLLVKMLISFGANINATVQNKTPLEEAVRCRRKDVVIYFVEELMMNMEIQRLQLDETSQTWIRDLLEERQIGQQRSITSCSCM